VSKTTAAPPRVLIEDWLPAAAIGVECIRERSTGQQPPDKRLHVWWARRPLTASRAAVLASLLPADFPHETFERLLGFGRPSAEIVSVRRLMDTGYKVPGGFGYDRAFKNPWREDDMQLAQKAAKKLWGDNIAVIDPMAGGGSIPLEAARLGFRSLANEYNPVACTVLEATVDYPFRFGEKLARAARKWGKVWEERIAKRLASFYPVNRSGSVHAYIFARTVPCPDTQYHTPLVPDWHLLKPKSGVNVVAEPQVEKDKGSWRVRIREIGGEAGRLREPPKPSYSDGKGISLFTGRQIPSDYIKAKAQAGEMRSALYAVAIKTPQGLRFLPPDEGDLKAIKAAEKSCTSCGQLGKKQMSFRPSYIQKYRATSGRGYTGCRDGLTCFRPASFSALVFLSKSFVGFGRKYSIWRRNAGSLSFYYFLSFWTSLRTGTAFCHRGILQRVLLAACSIVTIFPSSPLGVRWLPCQQAAA